MKAVFTPAALADLDDILSYTARHFPQQVKPLERRVRQTIERLEIWPLNARELANSAGVRVVPLLRYPFKIFYRIENDSIAILHVYHTARRTF
ncbi:MAG TPA: type II toxin-antitoxin system RelE/ParE family toxin [Rhizomicrobium sp.]|jgi:plasmid stabilization system protein ParE